MDLPQVTLYVISELDLQVWLLSFKTENSVPITVLCICLPGHLGNFSLFSPYSQPQESLRWGLTAEFLFAPAPCRMLAPFLG